ncbi:MAG: hypothetical protein GY938_00445 [Ketobacter sp.]|nr:hypothetical protein [Ketobacter sp.]
MAVSPEWTEQADAQCTVGSPDCRLAVACARRDGGMSAEALQPVTALQGDQPAGRGGGHCSPGMLPFASAQAVE